MTRATLPSTPPGTSVRRSRLSTDLATAVVDMIAADKLVAGQAIPALRPLAERFGVAVPTMREALRRLEGMEILEFRHGSGIYVGRNSDRLVLANALAPRPTGHQLVQLLSARLVIEPPLAGLAARNRTAADVERLSSILQASRSFLDSGDERLVGSNVDLHCAIAIATGNPVLEQVLESVAAVHSSEQAEILALHGSADSDHLEHAALVQLVIDGDAEAAERAMYEHLAGVLAVVSSRIAERSPVDPVGAPVPGAVTGTG